MKKIDPQKVRDNADRIARMIEECAHEDATQFTDYACVQAMIALCGEE